MHSKANWSFQAKVFNFPSIVLKVVPDSGADVASLSWNAMSMILRAQSVKNCCPLECGLTDMVKYSAPEKLRGFSMFDPGVEVTHGGLLRLVVQQTDPALGMFT